MRGELKIKGKNTSKFVRVNRQINAPFVRVKDKGIMSVSQALELAYQEDLDLVETVPNATPPVCEIMDFGKYRFDAKKKVKEQENKNRSVSPKEIRLRPVSGDRDVEIKINQLKKFLEEKRTVSVSILFKNRELNHKDQGIAIIRRVIDAVAELGRPEASPRFEGKNLRVRIFPKTS